MAMRKVDLTGFEKPGSLVGVYVSERGRPSEWTSSAVRQHAAYQLMDIC